MADPDNPSQASAAEREEEERRRREKLTLDQEIARKYEVGRLSRMVVAGAGRGERLDLATRSQMERVHAGHDFSKVRIFRGSLAEEITAKHGADAVTVANTGMILVRQSPRSAPGTTAHQALLAHELTHVAQAQRGMHFALEHGSQGGEHEAEAEGVESEVASGVAAPNYEDDGSRQGGQQNEKSKREHRRRKALERTLELLWERRRFMYERLGRGHGF